MDFSELTAEERLALVGLLKAVIQADKTYSKEESIELRKVAQKVGEDLFNDTVEVAREQFKSLAAIKAHAETIKRQPARELIMKTLFEMAIPDELSDEEKELLEWLGAQWGIEVPGAGAA
jgi:uncharacterized tellurite resistance protein B-like protein